jgi:ankyrin repeat protein
MFILITVSHCPAVAFLDPPRELSMRSSPGLRRASERGDGPAVALFLKLPGIDVNAADESGVSALMSALNEDVAKLLLEAPQVLVNARDREGQTALMHAFMRANSKVARVLLEDPRINVHLGNVIGRPTWNYAVEGGDAEVLVMLLKVAGIDVDLKESRVRAMIIRAVQSKDITDILPLIEAADAKTNSGTHNTTELPHAACTSSLTNTLFADIPPDSTEVESADSFHSSR